MNTRDVFNSPVEIGARIAVLLAGLGEKLGLDDLVYYDYAATYSQDFQGSSSLHPALMNRLAELVRRREIFPQAIKLYVSKGLIASRIDESGVRYYATPNGTEFVHRLNSEYHVNLKGCVHWVSENIDHLNSLRRNLYKFDREA